MKIDHDGKEFLKRIIDGSYQKIIDSNFFIGLLTHEDAMKAPEVLLQFGIAVLHDKPIIVVAEKGVSVSKNLQKIATEITYYETEEDIQTNLEKAIKKAGFA